jgi:hypothetical protein
VTGEQRDRVRGSFVLWKNDRLGYIPVTCTSRAAIMKEFVDPNDVSGAKVPKLKISSDGSESGSYFSAAELESATGIKSVWLGVATVGGEAGAQADKLRVGGEGGGIPVSIRPRFVSSGGFTEGISWASYLAGAQNRLPQRSRERARQRASRLAVKVT